MAGNNYKVNSCSQVTNNNIDNNDTLFLIKSYYIILSFSIVGRVFTFKFVNRRSVVYH